MMLLVVWQINLKATILYTSIIGCLNSFLFRSETKVVLNRPFTSCFRSTLWLVVERILTLWPSNNCLFSRIPFGLLAFACSDMCCLTITFYFTCMLIYSFFWFYQKLIIVSTFVATTASVVDESLWMNQINNNPFIW